MPDATYETLIAAATSGRGDAYLSAREALLALEPQEKNAAAADLTTRSKEATEWNERLTAEIIAGWIDNGVAYEQCAAFASGVLPGPRPLAGFTAKHRIEAILALGNIALPRVLEMVWKIPERGDDTQSAALFGVLARAPDERALMPMVEIFDSRDSAAVRTSAIGVLAAIGGDQALAKILAAAESGAEDDAVRARAIRALGQFTDSQTLDALTSTLLDEAVAESDRLAAAEGLGLRQDPATRPAVIQSLQGALSEDVLLALIGLMAEIGVPQDIPALETLSNRGGTVRDYAEDAIEEIRERE